MSDIESLRRDIVDMVRELRSTINDIGTSDMPLVNVVSNTRDRLRYISALTEQSAGQTLNATEAILERLHAQQAMAALLMHKTRSPQVRAFLGALVRENQLSVADASEIIQAQAFQDLVG